MLTLTTGQSRDCDRISRRSFVQVGALAGLGVSLPLALAAKRAAAKAEKRASPKAIIAWRQEFADHQAERDAALTSRRALALMPSEQAEDEQQRRHERERAEAMRARRAQPRQVFDPESHSPTANRPRPGRRPR